MIRRELPRSKSASSRPEPVSHRTLEDSPFDNRPIRSVGQGGPDEAGELAGDGGDDVLFRFAARGDRAIAAMQPLLRGPRLRDDGRRRTALSRPQRVADERMMTVMPRGFDEHPPQMRIAGLGDPARAPLRPTRMFGGISPTKAIVRGAVAKRRASPSSAAIVNAVRSSMPRKHRRRCTRACNGSRSSSARRSLRRAQAATASSTARR